MCLHRLVWCDHIYSLTSVKKIRNYNISRTKEELFTGSSESNRELLVLGSVKPLRNYYHKNWFSDTNEELLIKGNYTTRELQKFKISKECPENLTRRKTLRKKRQTSSKFRDTVPLKTWSIGQCGKRTTARRERLSQSCFNICTRYKNVKFEFELTKWIFEWIKLLFFSARTIAMCSMVEKKSSQRFVFQKVSKSKQTKDAIIYSNNTNFDFPLSDEGLHDWSFY